MGTSIGAWASCHDGCEMRYLVSNGGDIEFTFGDGGWQGRDITFTFTEETLREFLATAEQALREYVRKHPEE